MQNEQTCVDEAKSPPCTGLSWEVVFSACLEVDSINVTGAEISRLAQILTDREKQVYTRRTSRPTQYHQRLVGFRHLRRLRNVSIPEPENDRPHAHQVSAP